MGLLDWLTDGTLGNMGGISGGESGSPPPMNMPQPPTPMPPVQQTGSDALAIAPPPQPNPGAMAPPVDPSTQAIGGGTGAGPGAPTPDPTPAAGPPDPPIPLPAPRPPGAGAAPPAPSPGPGPAAPPSVPSTPPAAPGAPLSLAPTAPGPSAPAPGPYKLGDQTALGRALGIDPHSKSFNETLGGIGAGLTAAGNSKGKSPFQALASGAGATIEGGNKEAHAIEKDNIAYLNAAIAAQKAGDTKGYQENMIEVQKGKLKLEQLKAASPDASNKNDTPTQLYLRAQERLAKDPYVKTAQDNLKDALKNGSGPNDPNVIAAQANVQKVMQDREAGHLATLGLHPQDAAKIAQQPGMSQGNPVTAGLNEKNFSTKMQVGQYYTDKKAITPDNPKGLMVVTQEGLDRAKKQAGTTPSAGNARLIDNASGKDVTPDKLDSIDPTKKEKATTAADEDDD